MNEQKIREALQIAEELARDTGYTRAHLIASLLREGLNEAPRA